MGNFIAIFGLLLIPFSIVMLIIPARRIKFTRMKALYSLSLALFLVVIGASMAAPEKGEQAITEPEETGPTMAEQWIEKATIETDMSSFDFMTQVSYIRSEADLDISRDKEDPRIRVFTLTWKDGSSLVTLWTPAGGKKGLKLKLALKMPK